MRTPLTHKLPSGRVLLLHEPFDLAELAAARTPEGVAALERLADEIAKRATAELATDSAAGQAMLRQYGVTEGKATEADLREFERWFPSSIKLGTAW